MTDSSHFDQPSSPPLPRLNDFLSAPAPLAFIEETFATPLHNAGGWNGVMIAVLKTRDAAGSIGAWRERIRRAHGVASTGEAAVLQAFLCAIDYRWLAEELALEHGRPFLRLFERTHGAFRIACLACQARCD